LPVRPSPAPGDLVIPCALQRAGQPVPDIVRTFSDPIRIPCRIVRRTRPGSAASDRPLVPGEGADRQPGPLAPIPALDGTAPISPVAETEAMSPVRLDAAGAAFALGSTAALPAGGLGGVPSGLLGSALAVAAAVAMLRHLAAMTGDRNAGEAPRHCGQTPSAPGRPPRPQTLSWSG